MMRLTIGLPGFLLPTTLHHVCGAVACFPIRLSRLHLIFSVSANSIRRIVTVAVSNRLNPIVGRIRWEKNRLADITSRRLPKKKENHRCGPLYPLRERRYTHWPRTLMQVSPTCQESPTGDRHYLRKSRLICVNRKMSVCSHASGSAQTPACSRA
jgi:hypothetical protein